MLLGIDGGGSKTLAWLTDDRGRLLGLNHVSGTNINDIGGLECKDRLFDLLTGLLKGPTGLRSSIDSVYAGIAGCISPTNAAFATRTLQSLLPNAKRVRVEGDIFNGLFSLEGMRDGICAVAGTGSGAYVRMGREVQRVGGWGHLIDDAGSGYDLGRQVIKAVLRAWDGRGEDTLLTEMLQQALDGTHPQDAIASIYAGGKAKIASFAPLAFQAASKGDKIARIIVLSAEESLQVLIATAAHHLRQEAQPYVVALCGGLWKASGLIKNVQKRLGPDYILRLPILPPVSGCVAAAADLCGLSGKMVLSELRKSFTKEEDPAL